MTDENTSKGTSKVYVKKKRTNFQRTKFRAYVKLGKGQKSKQKYRKATGRHNKTRQKWKGRPRMAEIGYRNKIDTRNLINGKMPINIKSLNDLKNITKDNIIIIGKIGMKAKVEIIKEVEKQGLEIVNVNVKKFLRQVERAMKHRKKERELKKSKAKAKKEAKGKKSEEKESKEKIKDEKKATENKDKPESKEDQKKPIEIEAPKEAKKE